MSQLIQVQKPIQCACIDCENDLTEYEMNKIAKVRGNKFRFCKLCRFRYNRNRELIWKCKGCENLITSTRMQLQALFCSEQCRSKFYYSPKRKIPTIRKCLTCKKNFYAKWAQYCSQKCRNVIYVGRYK